MKYLCLTVWAMLGVLTTAIAAAPAERPTLNAHLEPLRPFLKTWKGTFKNSTPEKPVIDIARWERALNGQAVRLTHSINNGSYGGETLIVWDEQKQGLVFYYFTTAGFMTTGTIEFKDGKVITHEDVKGSAQGITEVRGTSELRPDGKFFVKTEYRKDGEWSPGRETLYEEAPGAEVVFK
jgi:hypothetical protein